MTRTATTRVYVIFANGEAHEFNHTPSILQAGDRVVKRAEFLPARAAYLRAELLKILAPGATVYTQLRHKAASGMSRAISLHAVHDGRIRCIDGLASDLIGAPVNRRHGGLTVNGCGMDMGFSLVYSLGAALWPQGTPKPHGRRNGAPDSAGGYALKHEWL